MYISYFICISSVLNQVLLNFPSILAVFGTCFFPMVTVFVIRSLVCVLQVCVANKVIFFLLLVFHLVMRVFLFFIYIDRLIRYNPRKPYVARRWNKNIGVAYTLNK